MGAIVGAGLLGHVPSIMLPEEQGKSLSGGRDSTFPRALQDIFQERIQPAEIDTFLISIPSGIQHKGLSSIPRNV